MSISIMKSYDYQSRRGIKEISWKEFGFLSRALSESLSCIQPQIVIGIARAGLFPAAAVACMLRLELYPVRITRRENDRIVHQSPIWKVPILGDLENKKIIVIDEIADTGETLSLVKQAVYSKGAKLVHSAALISHSWAEPAPDISALVSDELIIFPWDKEVLIEGKWQIHPEIAAAIQAQSRSKQ